MQAVYMSEENRRLVEGVLKDLRGPEAEASAAGEGSDDEMDEGARAAQDALTQQLAGMGFQVSAKALARPKARGAARRGERNR